MPACSTLEHTAKQGFVGVFLKIKNIVISDSLPLWCFPFYNLIFVFETKAVFFHLGVLPPSPPPLKSRARISV